MAHRYPSREEFTTFAHDVEPRLRYALVAACGPDLGLEATEDTLAYAWEHWNKVSTTRNPAGYLYRIGKRRALRRRRDLPLLTEAPVVDPDPPEPGLDAALADLTAQQRTAVVLIDGFGYTNRDVAQLLGVGRSTVQKHHERGLEKLRRKLGVSLDV